jgi:hypothetical protein
MRDGEGKFGKAFLLKCDEAEYMLINNGDNKFYNTDEFYKDHFCYHVTPNSKNLEKNIKIEGLELLSDLDLSPKVYDSWICKTSKRPCGYMVDMTLNNIFFDYIFRNII